MKKRNVLVFPAGTEIGLEILHALEYCKEVRIFGAGEDVPNPARFVFPEYLILPSIHDERWLKELIGLCQRLEIEYIFPGHDDVLLALSREQDRIPAVILTSPREACETTRSKSCTYRALGPFVRVPYLYASAAEVVQFPVLVKPDRGQGSYGVSRVACRDELVRAMSSAPAAIICEYLPGEEYTVDCFSDRERGLLFAGARARRRIRNGIAVNTITVDLEEAWPLAQVIGEALSLRGAWFFQLKRADRGELALLEVAPRIAGSMAVHRMMGVNFPLLSIFEHERLPFTILTSPGTVELDRALANRYCHGITFSTLYLDLDDTLLINGQVNTQLVKLIFSCVNRGRKVKLMTRHAADLSNTLSRYRLSGLFDEIIHLGADEPKSARMTDPASVFVDDSFSERLQVSQALGIPTFDCSMVDLLVEQCHATGG